MRELREKLRRLHPDVGGTVAAGIAHFVSQEGSIGQGAEVDQEVGIEA